MKLLRRKFEFDAGHRVLNHPGKCKDLHGHRYYGEIAIGFEETQDIGYAIDFGDVKKIALSCFDHFFDHGMILNPTDSLKIILDAEGKVYIMSYYEDEMFRNPTAENIATEMLCMLDVLFEDDEFLHPHSIKLYETPNCSVEVCIKDLSIEEVSGFDYQKGGEVREFKKNII